MNVQDITKQANEKSQETGNHFDWELDQLLKPMTIDEIAELDLEMPTLLRNINKHQSGKFGRFGKERQLAGIKSHAAREIRQRAQ